MGYLFFSVMATVSTSLSIKSSSCTYSSGNQQLHHAKSVPSSCSFGISQKFQLLQLSSTFLCSPSQVIKLKSKGSRSRQQVRSVGGMEIKMMSVEAGVGVMGTKLGMMSFFEEDGKVVPVTIIGFKEGNIVTQVKTESTDGYNAVQVGYERVRDRKLTKPEIGHLNKSNVIPLRHLQEFRLVSVDDFSPSQKLSFEELFTEGDMVDVSGTTIGKGFQGHFLTA